MTWFYPIALATWGMAFAGDAPPPATAAPSNGLAAAEGSSEVEQVPDGILHIDAHIPMELRIDGQAAAVLFRAGNVEIHVPSGEHDVQVFTNGNPTPLKAHVPPGDVLRILVGRHGIQQVAAEPRPPPEQAGPTPVEFRAVGTETLQLRLGVERVSLPPRSSVVLDLASGPHPVSLRNMNGTVIWASGTLAVAGSDPVLVVVREGRYPEITGNGSFSAQPR